MALLEMAGLDDTHHATQHIPSNRIIGRVSSSNTLFNASDGDSKFFGATPSTERVPEGVKFVENNFGKLLFAGFPDGTKA